MLGPMGGELETIRATALNVLRGDAPILALQGPLVQALRAEGKGKEARQLEAEVFTGSESAGEGKVFMGVTMEEIELVQAFRDLVGDGSDPNATWARDGLAAFKVRAEGIRPASISTKPVASPAAALAASAALLSAGQVDTDAGAGVDENPSEQP